MANISKHERPMWDFPTSQLKEMVDAIPLMPDFEGKGRKIYGLMTLPQMEAMRELEIRKHETSMAYGKPNSVGANGEVKSRAVQLMEGIIDVSELDNEELARKRTRSRDGKFSGRRPEFGEKILLAMEREYNMRFVEGMRALLSPAQDTIKSLMASADKDSVRLAAAQAVIDRVVGKVPDKQIIDQTVTTHSSLDAEIKEKLAKLLEDADPSEPTDIVDAVLVSDDDSSNAQDAADAPDGSKYPLKSKELEGPVESRTEHVDAESYEQPRIVRRVV